MTMDELTKLKREYMRSLPARLEMIEQLMQRGDARSREEAISILHKIHGTAGSYDLDDISEMAGDCEEHLRSNPSAGDAVETVKACLKGIRKSLGEASAIRSE